MAVVGEVERFLDRGVAAADHRDLLAAVEEAVAGRAGRGALALHMLFGRQAEPFGLGAGGDDQRVGMIFGAAVALQHERAARQVDLGDMVPHHLGADMLGLGLHLLHQPGALDDVAEAGIIFDVGGGGQLAAGLDALDDDRRKAGARGIDGGGVAGGAGAEDDQAAGNDVAHRAQLGCDSRVRQWVVKRLEQEASASGRPPAGSCRLTGQPCGLLRAAAACWALLLALLRLLGLRAASGARPAQPAIDGA